MTEHLRLGVNIDHVATVRNARGAGYPDPVRAALLAAEAGADGITAHLREDRRHITDDDIERLSAELTIPLNLEMAATDEMFAIAMRHRPHAACFVPEKREERTTEGGLDAAGMHNILAPMVAELGAARVRVSLFVEPDARQIEAALRLGAPVIELHTGRYAELEVPLNLEMAATDEMLAIALRHLPHAACIVPEKREERTTEGGLDAAGQDNHLRPYIARLIEANIRVSLFIEPDPRQIEAALRLGAPVVELHTGRYAELEGEARAVELRRLADAAALAAKNGIEVHAGHGLTFDNVQPIAAIPQVRELNIGHFLVGEALFVGLGEAVRRMRELMDAVR